MNIDFVYRVTKNVISIIDLDKGNKSVTNGIEEVLEFIREENNINLKDFIIIYKDSQGNWDGFDASTGSFYSLYIMLTNLQKLERKHGMQIDSLNIIRKIIKT